MNRTQYLEKAAVLRKGRATVEIIVTDGRRFSQAYTEHKTINAAKRAVRNALKSKESKICVALNSNEYFPERAAAA